MKFIYVTLSLLTLVTDAIAEIDNNLTTNKNSPLIHNDGLLQALGGEAIQQYNKGYYYLTGTGDVQKNNSEAKKWFNLAAKSLSPAVRYKIGRLFETGTLYKQSYIKAVEHYRFSAKKGDVYAINNLAILYINGTGVPKDVDKGIRLLTQAAQMGNAEAQVNLGLYYLTAKQEHHNIKNALKWFTEAGKTHNPVALYYLAEHAFAEQDYIKAYDYYLMSAQQSNDTAQLKLAMLYAKGLGVEKDSDTANDWLTKAAELGNKRAIGMLKKRGK